MFDTMKVAKKIRQARIAQNLTQMNLADAMGVSYQAVSNWERGNSMPDISKLEDLCQILHLSPAELLGMENSESAAVTRIMTQEDASLTAEELSELAPVLPPVQVKEQAKKQKLNIASLVAIAPYLDENFLEELSEDVEVENLLILQSLAPYLDEDTLDKLARRAQKVDFNGIAALAPFLEEDTLDYLVRHCTQKPEDWAFLQELASFLSKETLDWTIRQWGGDFDRKMLTALGPFLEEQTIDALVRERIAVGDTRSLTGLLPFMEEEAVRGLVRAFMDQGDLEAMKEAARFL